MRNPALVDKHVLAEPPAIPLVSGFPPQPQKLLRQLIARPRTALSTIGFLVRGMGPAAAAARKGRTDKAIARMGRAILGEEAFNALSPARMQQVRDNFIAAELTSDQFMMPLPDAEIRRIRAPTLLVTGETSPPLWHRLAERLADLIPDSKLVDIPASSHIMHEDNAPAYNRAALAFLQS